MTVILLGFNPTLVRLARGESPIPAGAEDSFNPTLVRLARSIGPRPRPSCPVSIPPWFD